MDDDSRSAKQPAIQFYPGDWRKDPAVTCLSLPAKAVWFEMLLLMWESPERGYLRHKSGSQITPEQLARSVGSTVGEIKRCLSEMEDAGTFSRLEDGTIYNRRMIRDERIRVIRKEAGRLGGNPNLLNQKVKQNGKQNPTPSSSSSSSSSDILSNTLPHESHSAPNGAGRANGWRELKFEEFWEVCWLKRDKGHAKPVFLRKAKTPQLADVIIEAARMQGPEIIRAAAKSGITPVYPATWLNGERWFDEPPAPPQYVSEYPER